MLPESRRGGAEVGEPIEPVKPKEYVLFLEHERCMGCWNCYLACATEHSMSKNLYQAIKERPPPVPRLRVTLPKDSMTPYVVQCMHCEDPPCMNVCPVGAISKGPDGIVRIDERTCIGCRMCVRACPFGAMLFNPIEGVAIKCDMCEDRLREGFAPACVTACPTGALMYGDLEDILSRRRKSVATTVSVASRTSTVPVEAVRPKKPSYKDAIPPAGERWW